MTEKEVSSPSEAASLHLETLCMRITTRQMGSDGNREATDYFAHCMQDLGYRVEDSQFNCIDWKQAGASCIINNRTFQVNPSPYSLGCEITATLHQAGTLSDLQSVNCRGEVLLLHTELTREQLMPKGYPFYNPELHQLVIGLLEQKEPAAIIAATTRNPELAGAVYPFPLFEDGNFDIPSVYTTTEVGEELLAFTGSQVHLVSRAERIPSTGSNVIARLNPGAEKKILLCAHIDAKIGTPGAVDNAAGVVTLLLIAELMSEYSGQFELEFLAMNGEDYYGANGELLYLAQNESKLQSIELMINLDGLGFLKGRTAFSFYNLTHQTIAQVKPLLESRPGVFEGEPWYQSDHMVFVMNGVPAIAVTTENFVELECEIAHTSKDVPELVDVDKLVDAAYVIKELILAIE